MRNVLPCVFLCRVVAAAGLGWGCGGAAAAADGPSRIVSLGPAITEQLRLLGQTSNLVGVTTYCQLPDGHAEVARVGSVTGINVEQILVLKPDVVLAVSLTDPRFTRKLERFGIRVESFAYAKDFTDICEQFLRLGGLVGAAEPARAMVERVRERVAGIEAAVRGRARPGVFVEVGARPLFTANRDTFIHDMIVRAGGRNIAADAESGFYSREQVVADDPEVIVIVTMGIAAEEERAAWLAATPMRAAASRRVHILDAYTVCSPTPARFAESVELFARLLHPDLPGEP